MSPRKSEESIAPDCTPPAAGATTAGQAWWSAGSPSRVCDTEEAERTERMSHRDTQRHRETKDTKNLCVSVSPWRFDSVGSCLLCELSSKVSV